MTRPSGCHEGALGGTHQSPPVPLSIAAERL